MQQRGRLVGLTLGACLVLATLLVAAAAQMVRSATAVADENWVGFGVAASNITVRAVASDASGTVYAGGDFTAIGNVSASRIAKWNGREWTPLGSGLNGPVYAIAVSGSDVFAGGDFTEAGGIPANRVARWNGQQWMPMGAGANGRVRALTAMGSNLYVGGEFSEIGGTGGPSYVAGWNGTVWFRVGQQGGARGPGLSGNSRPVPGLVNSLISAGDILFAGISAPAGGGVLQWDGAQWTRLGDPFVPGVLCLAMWKGTLYAGSGQPGGLVKWDGKTWVTVGGGLGAARPVLGARELPQFAVLNRVAVIALAASDTGLYVGGLFASAGNVDARGIAKWNGEVWSPVGEGIFKEGDYRGAADGPRTIALAVAGKALYAGGSFKDGGGDVRANGIAQWNGETWATLGNSGSPGLNGEIRTVAVSEDGVYAGGIFTQAGTQAVTRVARWNGSAWLPLGSGVGTGGDEVYALAVSGNDVYVGGRFRVAGGLAAINIAKWDGKAWSALGAGSAGAGQSEGVLALAVSPGGLYAAFRNGRVSMWDGVRWRSIGVASGYINALAVAGEGLYASGTLTAIDGIPVRSRLAYWNGSAWSAAGDDTKLNFGSAVAVSGKDVFIGGNFTRSDEAVFNGMAHWDGLRWNPMSSGMSGVFPGNPSNVPVSYVYALTIFEGSLYAVGDFMKAGSATANGIAKWDGRAWAAVGTGLDGPGRALAVSKDGLYVGGAFTHAGGKLSPFFALLKNQTAVLR